MPISSADVLTSRPDHYARELVKDLARRVPASLDGGTTRLVLERGQARVTPVDGVLRLEASAADDASLTSVEDELAQHLLALGEQRELAVEWVRPSGRARKLVRSGAGTGRRRTAGRRPRSGSRGRPNAVVRRLLKLPAALYRADLGWLLGQRFLMLTHVGRRSGRAYDTVLEVLRYDASTRTAVVVAGLGRSSDWYLNLRHRSTAQVTIGRDRFPATHSGLSESDAAEVLADYERRNRWIAFVVRIVLSGLLGWRYYGTDDERRRLVAQLPLVVLRPVQD
jgi:deazaflavin-dependent oxidoreductase (nitroreductase family)